MRRIIGEKGYPAGHAFFLEQAKEQGWDGKLVWTDPFHPGFVLKIDQAAPGAVTDYARVQDYATGEVWAQWRTAEGQFSRRLFVSRVDNVVVLKLTGPAHKLSCQVRSDG